MPNTANQNSRSSLSIIDAILYLIAAGVMTMMSASFLLWLRF